MESKLTMLPEVAGDVLGLPGRLAEPLPHLPEHVLHRVHRICENTKPRKHPRKLGDDPNFHRIGGQPTQIWGEGETHSSGRSRRRRPGRRRRGCRRREAAGRFRWRHGKAVAEAGPRPPARASGTARTPGLRRRGRLRRWTRLLRAGSCRRWACGPSGAVRWRWVRCPQLVRFRGRDDKAARFVEFYLGSAVPRTMPEYVPLPFLFYFFY